jgi:hypothetical protein
LDFKEKINLTFEKVKKEDLFKEITSFLENYSKEYGINGFSKQQKEIVFYYDKTKTITYNLKENQC